MTISKFTTQNMKLLRQRLDAAIAAVGEEHGISIKCGNGGYGDAKAHFKIELLVKQADGTVYDAGAEDFKSMAKLVGLEPSDLGKCFVFQNSRYRVTGLSLKRTKFPISAVRIPDGKGFKFTPDQVKKYLDDLRPKTRGHHAN